MKTVLPFTLALLLVVAAGCAKRSPSPDALDTPAPVIDTNFGDGFYKEERTPTGSFHWVRQLAKFTITVEEGGNYQLTFRPVTVFTNSENTITVAVNGRALGKLGTSTFDLANPKVVQLSAPLEKGENAVTLKSNTPRKRLAADDDRTPAFGLVMPLGVEKVP